MNFTTLVLLFVCMAASSAWHLRVSLNDIFKGHCRTVSPRVCRKSVGNFDPDYSCGFILRSVCSGKNKIERVRVRRSAIKPNQEHSLHVTPLPKKMAFYDANADGHVTIKEFARTLGHDPRAFHVKDAFRVADNNGDGMVDPSEFDNDAWIFDDDFDDDDYDLDDTDEDSYKSTNFDLLDSDEDSSSSSEDSSHESASGDGSSGESISMSSSNEGSHDDSHDDSSSSKGSSASNSDSSTDGSSGSNSNDDSTSDDSSNSSQDDSTADSNEHGSDDSSSADGDDSKSSQSDSKDDSKDNSDSKEESLGGDTTKVLPDIDDLNMDDIVPKEMELGDGIIGETIENVMGDGADLELPELEAPDSDVLKNVGIAMALTKFQPRQNQLHPKIGVQSQGGDDHDHSGHSHKEFDFSKGQSHFVPTVMDPKPTMLSNTLLGIRGSGPGSKMRSVDSAHARERFNAIAMNNRRGVPASLWPSWIVS